MSSVVHSGAVDPYGITSTLEGEDFTGATAGRFIVRFANGDEVTFVATLSGLSATSATLSYTWQAGDLDDRQAIARYYPEVDIPSGTIVGNPRSFRVRNPFDSP